MTRFFHRWATAEGLTPAVLVRAVREIEDGLSDGDLGSGIVKKRVRVAGRGKSGGARVLLATNHRDRWIFVYGLHLLALSEEQIDGQAQESILIEIGPEATGAAEPHSPGGS